MPSSRCTERLERFDALAQLLVLLLELASVELSIGVVLPPVDAHLLGLVHRHDEQADPDGQQLDVEEVHLDVARDDVVITCSRASIMTPLLFDPGDKWEYGSNIDWCGQVVEGIRGKRLGEVLAERVFAPLGIADMAFSLSPSMRERLATMHQREADGSLTPLPDMQLPADPEVDMGGHGLHGSIGEYMKFIRMWLNDGAGPHGRVLNTETVEAAVRNGLQAHQTVTVLPGVIPSISNDAEFFPGLKKSWSYTFMVNDEDAPTGRPAGALGWAGLPNLFYWIDRKNGFGGYWATQILPFGDPISFGAYMDFETAAYAAGQARAAA